MNRYSTTACSGATACLRVRIRDREHDARHTRVREGDRARSGPSGVVARLERDDRRGAPDVSPARAGVPQGGLLGVSGAGAPVPAFPEDGTGGVQQDATDLGVGTVDGATPGERQRTAHRRGLHRRHGRVRHRDPHLPGFSRAPG